MGEIADLILEGHLCQYCGAFMEGAEGYPRTCAECLEDDTDAGFPIEWGKPTPATTKVACPHCGKKVKETGLHDHVRAKHKRGKNEL